MFFAQRLATRRTRGEASRRRSRTIRTLERLETREVFSVTPPLGDMTEGNAATWQTFASDSAAAVVADDYAMTRVGNASLRFDTASGFDTGVSYSPAVDTWNLSGITVLDFWVYGDNNNALAWQGVQPVVEFASAAGTMRLTPTQQVMPNHDWASLHVPLAGDDLWVKSTTGSFDSTNVTQLRLHQDTWGYGFRTYYDGIKFSQRSAAEIPPGGPAPPAGVNPDAISPRALLFVFDPILENKGGVRQHTAYHWEDPVQLTNRIVNEFAQVSHGLVNYQVVDTVIADQHAYFKDGYQYTDESWETAWETRNQHEAEFDYPRFIAENNLTARVDSGEIDEVWIYAGPFVGMWESAMAGPGAYWINGPTQAVAGERAFPIMGWNFERGLAEAMHSFGHRAESTLDHIYGGTSTNGVPNRDTNWAKFVYLDRYNPGSGLGGVGNIHFPVNGTSDYDYADTNAVLSRADNWNHYPDVEAGQPRLVSRADWERPDGDWQLGYIDWWYSHLPHDAGRGDDDHLANWWRYLTDINQFKSHSNLSFTEGVPHVVAKTPAVANGLTAVEADVVVDGALGRVDFYLDGAYLATDSVAPFTLDWKAIAASAGSHTVVAKAYELQNGTEGVSAPVNLTVSTGQPLSAGYAAAVPTVWHANETKTFPVTVTNTGTTPWAAGGPNPVHLGFYFSAVSGTSGDSLSQPLRVALPADLAPGASVTLNVTLQAPPTETGANSLRLRMVKEGVTWFQDLLSTSITYRTGQPLSAGYAAAVPTVWQANETKTFPVTVTNTGTTPWAAGGPNPVHLGFYFSAISGITGDSLSQPLRVALPADLAPGASVTLNVTMQSPPAETGANSLRLRMVKEGVTWFQDLLSTNITYGAGQPLSADYAAAVPTVWQANETKTFPVTVTNTGTTLWAAGGPNPVHLGFYFSAISGTTGDSLSQPLRVALPADLAPGASVTLSVTMQAPEANSGANSLRLRMVKEGVTWFQDLSSTKITLAAGQSLAAVYAATVPTVWQANETKTFPVTVTNTGTTPWNVGGANPVNLGVYFSAISGTSGDSLSQPLRVALPADLAPGASVTVNVTVQAPGANSGATSLRLRMVKEGVVWFQDLKSVAVNIV